MTVEELLDALQHVDPDAQVFVQSSDGDAHFRIVECYEGFLCTEGDGETGILADDVDPDALRAVILGIPL